MWIDHCYRCGGTFLELGEAGKAVGEHADPSKWRSEAFARPPVLCPMLCPSGHGYMWSYLLKSEDKQLEIEACGVCHGVWLDAHEAEALAAITTEVHHENARPGAGLGAPGMVAMYLLQLATLLPVEVHSPVKRKPRLIQATVALLTAIFVLQVVIAGTGQIEAFYQTFGFVPRSFARGENTWSLITHAFLHGGIMHLVGNLYTLYIFGDNVEDMLGRWRATILYLASGVAGGLLYFFLNLGSPGGLVGASGAISGLMGAYLVLLPRVRLWLVIFFIPLKIRAYWYMLLWLGLQVLIMQDPESRTAWEAHLGGFVAGVGLAFLLRRKEPVDRPPVVVPARA